MLGKEKTKEAYTIVVRNVHGDLLRSFEETEFEEAVKYMEGTGAVDISMYRLQLVKKGPRRK
jgi:hypothetical protein